MTTTPPDAVQMPPLPEDHSIWDAINKCSYAENATESLCLKNRVSDQVNRYAQAYAAQCSADLEAARAALLAEMNLLLDDARRWFITVKVDGTTRNLQAHLNFRHKQRAALTPRNNYD